VTESTSVPFEAWYRNPWVWLIIGIPAMTVIGCMFTIYLAVSRPDQLVHDADNGGSATISERR